MSPTHRRSPGPLLRLLCAVLAVVLCGCEPTTPPPVEPGDEKTLQERLWELRAVGQRGEDSVVDTLLALGKLQTSEGRLAEAVVTLEEGAAMSRELHGAVHPTTVELRTALAYAYRHLGLLDSARSEGETLLADLRAEHGSRHPETLIAAAELAHTLLSPWSREPPEAARPLVEEALELSRQAAPSQDIWYARFTLLSQLATVEHQSGNLEAARNHMEEAIEVAGTRLLPEAITLHGMRSNYAMILLDLGEADEAIRTLREALPAVETELGPNDAASLDIRWNLAYALGREGELEEALELHRGVHDRRRATLGDTSLPVLEAKLTIAELLAFMGDLEAAEEAYRAFLAVLGDMPEPNEWSRMNAEFALGEILIRQDRDAEASVLLEDLVARAEEAAPEHPVTLRAKDRLMQALFYSGELAAAAQLNQEILRQRRSILPADPSGVAFNLFYEGLILLTDGRREEAMAVLKPISHYAWADAETLDEVGLEVQDLLWKLVEVHPETAPILGLGPVSPPEPE